MAQNVVIAGASFSNVPSIRVPDEHNVYHPFVDPSPTTATDSDVASGKVYFKADGTQSTGTAIGGSGSGAVWQDAQGYVHLSDEGDIELQTKTVSPTESAQTVLADAGYYALDRVNVNAIPSNYVGSGITRRDSTDLSASGATVSVPSGYYASNASKSVASGTAGTPTATKGTVSSNSFTVTPSVTNTAGYISGGTKTGTAVTVTAAELVSGTKSITASGNTDVTNYATASVAAGSAIPAASISATGATVSTGTNTLTLSKTVSNTPQVSAGYVSSGTAGNSSVSLTASINTRSSSDLTVSGATVTVPSGYYGSSASKSVASGTAGTPTATKGSVSNHQVSVTPSVTNTTGYITGSTKTGTAVTVTASELVSGTKSITENGTGIDVTNYAAVDVAVSGGGGSDYTLVASKTYTVSTTSTTAIDIGTFETGFTSLWTSDAMVYVKIRDTAGQRNGYFYGCDAFIYNHAPYYIPTATSCNAICGNMYVGQSTGYLTSPIALDRTSSTATASGYGIYPRRLYNNGDIEMMARYSTTSSRLTGTIDGTFSVEVYLLKWPNNVPPYQG